MRAFLFLTLLVLALPSTLGLQLYSKDGKPKQPRKLPASVHGAGPPVPEGFICLVQSKGQSPMNAGLSCKDAVHRDIEALLGCSSLEETQAMVKTVQAQLSRSSNALLHPHLEEDLRLYLASLGAMAGSCSARRAAGSAAAPPLSPLEPSFTEPVSLDDLVITEHSYTIFLRHLAGGTARFEAYYDVCKLLFMDCLS